MEKFKIHTIDQTGHVSSRAVDLKSNEDAKAEGEEDSKKNPAASIHVVDAEGNTVLWKPAPTVNVHLYKKNGEHSRSVSFDVRRAVALEYAESWANYNPEHAAIVTSSDGERIAEFGAVPERLKLKK